MAAAAAASIPARAACPGRPRSPWPACRIPPAGPDSAGAENCGSGSGTPDTGSSREGPRLSSAGGSRDRGSRYVPPRRSPQCRQDAVQWNGPGPTTATCCPATTSSPSATSGRTGSYVVRSGGSPLPATSTASTPRPATGPANDTRPGAAASTRAPGPAARSTPRCPGPYGPLGGSHPRTTAGRPASGHERSPSSAPRPDAWAPEQRTGTASRAAHTAARAVARDRDEGGAGVRRMSATLPGPALSRGSWARSGDDGRVVDIAVTRHPAGPVHFLWRSG